MNETEVVTWTVRYEQLVEGDNGSPVWIPLGDESVSERVAQIFFGRLSTRSGVRRLQLVKRTEVVVKQGAEVEASLWRVHRDREWSDVRGRQWRWSDLNGWVVDNMARFGGHDPDGHGPFSAIGPA